MTAALSPVIEQQIQQLRGKWPQAQIEVSERYGWHLITIPNFKLPEGYNRTHCTLMFELPVGYPYAKPERFFTDKGIRFDPAIKDRPVWRPDDDGFAPWHYHPYYTNESNCPRAFGDKYPPGSVMWWGWVPQAWDRRTCTILTYARVCQQRLQLMH